MDSLSLSPSDFSSPGKVVQLGFEPNRIDIMTSITGVSFEDAWDSRVAGALEGIPIYFIGRQGFSATKKRRDDQRTALMPRSCAKWRTLNSSPRDA
jgi:hypothetical protein